MRGQIKVKITLHLQHTALFIFLYIMSQIKYTNNYDLRNKLLSALKNWNTESFNYILVKICPINACTGGVSMVTLLQGLPAIPWLINAQTAFDSWGRGKYITVKSLKQVSRATRNFGPHGMTVLCRTTKKFSKLRSAAVPRARINGESFLFSFSTSETCVFFCEQKEADKLRKTILNNISN